MDTAIVAPGPAVVLVTALAETADLSDTEYRALYDRVAAGRSLRNVELALRSGVTFGWWAGYANGTKHLDRARKNELRRWARENGSPDLADLPPTPGEVVAERVHPDAAVYQVGTEIASRVVLVGADVPAVALRVNGNCTAGAPALDAPLAGCNGRYSPQPDRDHKSHRVAYFRPCLSRDARERIGQLEALLEAAKAEVGV